MKFTYRPFLEADTNFILNSWLKSYRSSGVTEHIPSTIYFTEHKKTVLRLMEDAKILVCCNPEDEEQIFGWTCYEEPLIIHFIYVKYPYRKFGMAKSLYNTIGSPTITSHLPRSYSELKKKYNLIYNPYDRDTQQFLLDAKRQLL